MSCEAEARKRVIYRVTFVGFVVNLVLTAMKFAAGIVGRSGAMVADAVHSCSDMATDVVVIAFAKISAKPRDDGHDYGHGKYETLATIIISLALAAVESMTGFNPIPGMTPIADAMATVSSIAVVLLGSLPIAELVRRLLMRPFAWLGERLHMKPQSLTGMLISLVSSLPTLSMYEEMDNRGKVAVGAFVVSGTSLLAAHMAFTVSAEPTMLAPVLVAKLTGALAAAVLALCLKSGPAETGKAV